MHLPFVLFRESRCLSFEKAIPGKIQVLYWNRLVYLSRCVAHAPIL